MLMANPLNQSSVAFPLLEFIHVTGFVCGLGIAALVPLRLLGFGLTNNSAAKVWRETSLWTLAGFTLAIVSGLLLFSIDPEMYFNNHAFRLKLLALPIALAFHYTFVRRATRFDKAPLIGSIAFALWSLVPLCGIYIGYT